MRKFKYIGSISQELIKSYVLCCYKMKSDIRNDFHYYIRPSLFSYDEIICKGKCESIDLLGCCYDFSYDEDITEQEIIMQCAIEGINLDFKLIEDSDYNVEKFIDLRTGKALWTVDLNSRKGFYAN